MKLRGIDQGRLNAIRQREEERFAARTKKSACWLSKSRERMPNGVPMGWMAGLYRHLPIVAVSGKGPVFRDLDGNEYLDFNLCDLSMPAGFTPQPVIRATCEQVAKGCSFLLPSEDSLAVCELLEARFGLPCWQFTLSASQANTEALRLARVATGRKRVIIFGGRYHGHIDDTLWSSSCEGSDPEYIGLPPSAGSETVVIPFNDLDALDRELGRGDVAAVLTEPALTNCTLVLPHPAFHDGLRRLTRQHGALLIIDETHTQFALFGGGTHEWSLQPDMVTGGKGIAGGIPIGVYGFGRCLAEVMEAHAMVDPSPQPGIATGGTLFANALSLTAARAGLAEVFTEEAHKRVAKLGERLSAGIEKIVLRHDLPWCAFRLGGRSGLCLAPELPRNGEQGLACIEASIVDTRKVYMANRGVWDAIATAGPSVSFVHGENDIDSYIEVLAGFVSELVG